MEVMIDEKARELSQVFKTLGDPTRIRIVHMLSQEGSCVCDISEKLEMTQSAISHQLRIMRNLRLVRFEKKGRHVKYYLDDEHVLALFQQGLEHISHK